MSMQVIKPGPLTTLQDWGRFSYQHLGMATAGPADEHAFLWANKLVQNSPSAPAVSSAAALEISMGLLSCVFTQPTRIALCGAEMQARLNGEPLASWCSVRIRAGDRLDCQYARSGMRSYLAIAGGFQEPVLFGSRATLQREGLGAALGAGDELAYPPSESQDCQQRVPPAFIPDYPQQINLDFLPGYQWNLFSSAAQEQFLEQAFILSPQSDRMGSRLAGEPLAYAGPTLLSEGIAYGAVQIPADGLPIILGKDRQCVGGYPKLGCVTRLAMNRLSQAQPGCTIRFYKQCLDTAIAQWSAYQKFFAI